MILVKHQKYAIEDTYFNQLDFIVNHSMFTFAQFKLAENYNDPKEFKKLKIPFHAVLGKTEEDVFSLVKIVKIISINLDTLFEGVLQNYRYSVV